MIQRIQSLFLLLAFLTALIIFFLSKDLPIVNLLSIVVGILSLGTIFFYARRKQQIRLTIANIALSVAALIFAIISNYQLNMDAPILVIISLGLVIIFLSLALNFIRKDDKLVKSVDRFR